MGVVTERGVKLGVVAGWGHKNWEYKFALAHNLAVTSRGLLLE